MIAAWAPALLLLAGRFVWPGAIAIDGQALADPARPGRPAAVEQFVGRYGVAASTPALLPLLGDRDPGVRLVAARTLARAGDARALAAAAVWVTEPGRPAADRLLGLDVLSRAPELTAPARAALEQALRDREAATRSQALAALARQEAFPSLPAILRALDDEIPEVRAEATSLVGTLCGADPVRAGRAVLPLLARLDDPDQSVRIQALRALGSLHDPRTISSLLRLATDEPNGVGTAAVDALGSPPMAAAVPALIDLARDVRTEPTARHALLALGEIATPPAIEALVAALRRPTAPEEASLALRHAGAAAVPALATEAARGTPTGAVRAATLLGELGDRRATPALASAVEEDNRGLAVSLAAIDALATLRDPAAVPALARAAVAPEPDLRRQALLALRAIGDPRGAALLAQELADADPPARAAAAALAGTVRAAESLSSLATLLADRDPLVRRAAARALARIAAGPPPLPAAAASSLVPPLLAALGQLAGESDAADDAEALGDILETVVGDADRARLVAAFRTVPTAAAQGALARALAVAHADRPLTDRAAVDRLIALVTAGGRPALAAADALAVAHLSDAAGGALLGAAAGAEPALLARLCPVLARLPDGGERLAALIAAADQALMVRAAAAWAARGLGPARGALEAATRATAEPLATNARAALAGGAGSGWAAVRLRAPDGTPVLGRWVRFRSGVRTVVALTDESGLARVVGLDGRAAISFEAEGQRLQAAP